MVAKYFTRAGTITSAETLSGIPVGMNGIYDQGRRYCGGRKICGQSGVPAAFPISILTYDLSFGRMKLKELRATSVASNRSLYSYVRKLWLSSGAGGEGRAGDWRSAGGHGAFHFTIGRLAEARTRLLPLAQRGNPDFGMGKNHSNNKRPFAAP